MEFALLALLGVGVMAALFSDTGSNDADEPEPEPEPENVEAVLEDYEDITTGAGDDTITGLGGAISTGAGDDVIDMDGQVQGDVDAGPGDDFVSASGYSNRIEAGDGNDTISARIDDATSFYGGDGDDLFQMTRQTTDEGSVVDGGAGDDRFEIQINLPDEFDDLTRLTGGEGADAFALDVGPLALIETYAFPDQPTRFDPIEITDFDPAEDTLEITLQQDLTGAIGESRFAEYVDIDVTEDANGSVVVLNFEQAYENEGPDSLSGVQQGQFIIRMPGATGVDPAMIRVMVEA